MEQKYVLWKHEHQKETELKFDNYQQALSFLNAVYDYIWTTEYVDGILITCKTTAISQFKICDWMMVKIGPEGSIPFKDW